MHAVETYISVCGEGNTNFHVCIRPQHARGWIKTGRAEMSLRALELHKNQWRKIQNSQVKK